MGKGKEKIRLEERQVNTTYIPVALHPTEAIQRLVLLFVLFAFRILILVRFLRHLSRQPGALVTRTGTRG